MPKGPARPERPPDTGANAVWSKDDSVALIDAAKGEPTIST